MTALTRLPQPVIARVHGIATAAGCQLVAACDLAVAADDSRFATSGVKYGLFCSTPMVALVAQRRAQARHGDAAHRRFHRRRRGLRLGLVNRVAPADGLDAAVDCLVRPAARQAARRPGAGQARLLPPARARPGPTPTRSPPTSSSPTRSGSDFAEGLDAFVHKRKPEWPEP